MFALLLALRNARDALSRLPDEQRMEYLGYVDAQGRTRQVVMVGEAGVYQLIFRSRVPGAVSFQRWLTSNVLPSIRKHGYYRVPARSVGILPLRYAPDQPPDPMHAMLALVTEQSLVLGSGEECQIGRFIRECIQEQREARLHAGVLYEHYRLWCRWRSVYPMATLALFGRRFKRAGYRSSRLSGRIIYDGIAVSLDFGKERNCG